MLIVLLTDAPVDLKHLNVTIDSFSVLNESDKIDRLLIGAENETSFELLALQKITETISNANTCRQLHQDADGHKKTLTRALIWI